MRKGLLFISLIFGIIGNLSLCAVHAQNPLKFEKIAPNAIRIADAKDFINSPSGKFTALQTSSNFLLLPAEKLNQLNDLAKARQYPGKIIGFLPSGTLLYAKKEGVFALDPLKETSRKIFSSAAAKLLIENEPSQKSIVIASNDLVISGDGHFDWGAEKGNIYKYDLTRKRVTKGAEIWAFWYASLSPSGRFILYEHGNETTNVTEFYDISQNKNYPIEKFFDLKTYFPEYKETDQVPLVWLKAEDKFLAQISEQEDETDDKGFLALFDVAGKKMLWKKRVDGYFFPSYFQQLNRQTVLVSSEDGAFELSLTDGNLLKRNDLDGKLISVSPDARSIAFINSGQLFVVSANGGKRLLLDLPADWKFQNVYKAMGERPILWTADGSRLILFGENELLMVGLIKG